MRKYVGIAKAAAGRRVRGTRRGDKIIIAHPTLSPQLPTGGAQP
jgi:hypothetical protein